MILVHYRTVLRDPKFAAEHDEMSRITDDIARAVPGFISIEKFEPQPGTTVGLMKFETEEDVTAWREHPAHGIAHVRGVEELYSSYRVEIYHLDRKAGFDLES